MPSAQREASSAGHRRRGLSPVLNFASRFFAESLFKNSAFLVINLALSALCGYGSLALLTHIFSVKDVGLSTTAASAALLITPITLLGVTSTVPRYLPTAKNRTAMINTLLTAVILNTLLGSVIFLALPYAKNFYVLGGWVFALIFVVTTCAQAGATVVGTVLVADRSADKVATFGAIPNVARLVAPLVFSSLGGLGAFAARMVPDVFGFVTFGAVLARRGHRFRPAFNIGVVREIARFSVGMYFANIIGGLPQLLLPLIVLSRVGAKQAAYWSIAMSISAILYSLPSMVTQALLPEVSLRPTERRQLLRRASLLSLVIVAPVLLVAFFCAPIALAILGRPYVSGALIPVRWLIASGFVTILNWVTGTILFIAKKSAMITIVNIVDAVIVIGMVALWATKVVDVAIAWTVGDVANTVLFGLFAYLALREVGGRWEELGENQVSSADAVPKLQSATGQQQALGMLVTLAEQQRAADMYKPHNYSMTNSQALFSIAALRAAERQREEFINRGSPTADKAPSGLAETDQQALDLLFTLAKLQQDAGHARPGHHQRSVRGEPRRRDGKLPISSASASQRSARRRRDSS